MPLRLWDLTRLPLGQLELLLGSGSPWSLNSTCLLCVPRKHHSFLPRFDTLFPNQIQDLPNARCHKQQVLFFHYIVARASVI